MLKKLQSLFYYLIFISFVFGQFKTVNVEFDDRLLRNDEKNQLLFLKSNIKNFYEISSWNNDYSDLELLIDIQIIFEGSSIAGSDQTFGIQSLFTNNNDIHFFDKGAQFSLSQTNNLSLEDINSDPLSVLLSYYGNLILGAELDSWEPLGGSTHYEKARLIAVKALGSNFSRGWEQRLQNVNLLAENNGLRKLRYSSYALYEYFNLGEIDQCVVILENIILHLKEIALNYNQENYTNSFMNFHGIKIGEIMRKLGQKELLTQLSYYDPARRIAYENFLNDI